MNKLLDKASPYMKALVGGFIGAVVPLVITGLSEGWNWKAILVAGVSGAATAVGVYQVPNASKEKTTWKPQT
jgi:hypothetical protein